jgi:pre-rRNA-processing protein TSR1
MFATIRQESLIMEASGDSILGEQTWPSEDELRHADSLMDAGRGRERRTTPEALPSGMSSYQADWYMDDEGHFNDELASEDGDDVQQADDDDDMHLPSEPKADAKADAMFPDEMDTPQDEAARRRFARYRALQSFRQSPWHPKENLPQEYAKIYAFENFGKQFITLICTVRI